MIPVGLAKTVWRKRKQSSGSKIIKEQVILYLVLHRILNSSVVFMLVLCWSWLYSWFLKLYFRIYNRRPLKFQKSGVVKKKKKVQNDPLSDDGFAGTSRLNMSGSKVSWALPAAGPSLLTAASEHSGDTEGWQFLLNVGHLWWAITSLALPVELAHTLSKPLPTPTLSFTYITQTHTHTHWTIWTTHSTSVSPSQRIQLTE